MADTDNAALEFLRLIWAVDHGLQRRSKAMSRTLGLTGPQRLVIRMLGRFPDINAKQLAAVLHIHPSSLTPLLQRLERRGLIRRVVDTRDRRRCVLALTRAGAALDRPSPGTVEAAVQRTLRNTSSTQLQNARALLEALARDLDDPHRADGTVADRRPRRAR